MVKLLEILIVLLLSMTPLIENRGAMFFGFSVGITDPKVYLLGTILNILVIPVYFYVFSKIKLLKGFDHVNKLIGNHGPSSFAILIPLPSNGVNLFTSSLITTNLGFDKKISAIAIAIGIFLRGVSTYLVFMGLLSAAEIANISNFFYVLLFLFFIPILWSLIKKINFPKKKITHIINNFDKSFLLSIIFFLLAILSVLFTQLSLFFKIFINPIAVGVSDGKVISFLVYASLLFFAASKLKPYKKPLILFCIFSVFAAFFSLISFFMSLQSAYTDWSSYVLSEQFFFSNGHNSYNSLFHIHSIKPSLIAPLIFANSLPTEKVYDFGIVFLDYVPNYLFGIQFIFLLLLFASSLLAVSSFKQLWQKFAFLFASFVIMKCSIDGGPLNVEFIVAVFLLFLIWPRPKALTQEDYLKYASLFLPVLLTSSLLLTFFGNNFSFNLILFANEAAYSTLQIFIFVFCFLSGVFVLENKCKNIYVVIALFAIAIVSSFAFSENLNFVESRLAVIPSDSSVVYAFSSESLKNYSEMDTLGSSHLYILNYSSYASQLSISDRDRFKDQFYIDGYTCDITNKANTSYVLPEKELTLSIVSPNISIVSYPYNFGSEIYLEANGCVFPHRNNILLSIISGHFEKFVLIKK